MLETVDGYRGSAIGVELHLEHAEVVGARVGEPLGTLILTIAVTIIEVSIMVEMIRHGADDPTEARETVFSAVMIVCNGLVGLCVLIGGLRYREQGFQVSGANVYLSVLFVLATMTLIMPNYTTTTPGPVGSNRGKTSAVGAVDGDAWRRPRCW